MTFLKSCKGANVNVLMQQKLATLNELYESFYDFFFFFWGGLIQDKEIISDFRVIVSI